MFWHPSQLRMADLTDETFQSYVKHYMQHRFGNVHHIEEGPLSSPPNLQPNKTHRTDTPYALPGPASTPPAFTLSHLHWVLELALLASQVTNAETRRSSLIFSSCHPSSAKCVIPEEDAYLSDPLMYKEDKAYVPMTPKLLTAPVWEIMHGMGIKGKTSKVRAEDITRQLQISDHCWEHIGLQAVKQAM
ncbi:hypothetical protein DFH29DRAFT_1009249 [Suillus ampliporus]|nr:hypothetical protein DFH29DRAFT_1009249 [Suillus ampliporus]